MKGEREKMLGERRRGEESEILREGKKTGGKRESGKKRVKWLKKTRKTLDLLKVFLGNIVLFTLSTIFLYIYTQLISRKMRDTHINAHTHRNTYIHLNRYSYMSTYSNTNAHTHIHTSKESI